ncbi:MAG: aldo/keto reductase [Clostridia bacterium]|nr:aldo/keto reductase [Clostridia bacterium]
MNYRRLGKTELMVSEVGFGGEWLERHEFDESVALLRYAGEKGINIIDCWMPDPKSRDIIGKAIDGNREKWLIQGHIGSTWQGGQYVRTREMKYVKPAFEDLLARMNTDYMDLGMIHYVDEQADYDRIFAGSEYLNYVLSLKKEGKIRHIGLSTHNPKIAKQAAQSGIVEMILFSVNPAFDMRPATENLDTMWGGYDEKYSGIDPERAEAYRACEENDVGITVMKGYFGGALLNAEKSPFGVAFTPVQLLHYALTRPAVCSVLCGYDTADQIDAALAYETSSDEEKNYGAVIASAPLHSYKGICTYCGHCKPCPMEIDIAMVGKLFDLAAAYDEVPESVRAHYGDLSHKASECIGCRSCEERCPFGVEIAARMEKAAELFGE